MHTVYNFFLFLGSEGEAMAQCPTLRTLVFTRIRDQLPSEIIHGL